MASSYNPLVEGESKDTSKDPYYLFRDNVISALDDLEEEQSAWENVVESTNTASNKQFPVIDQKLKKNTKYVSDLIRNLSKTVSKVEKDRAKFEHISDNELVDRKDFIDSAKSRLRRVKDKSNSHTIRSKLESDRSVYLSGAREDEVGFGDYKDKEISQGLQAQEELIGKQDVVIEDMLESVQRLGVMGETIMVEIDAQQDMLEDFEVDMDTAEGRINQAIAKMEKLLKTKSRWKLCTIVVLAIILLALFFVIVSR